MEITETAIVDRGDAAAQVIQQLKTLGVRLAIDDFGVGQSSLAQLTRLGPVDEIKIDKSLIDTIATTTTAVRIVKAVIDVAVSDGLNVVAEGVEDPAQLAVLRDLGCPTIQGYLFAAPMPATALSEWAAQSRLSPPATTTQRSALARSR